MSASPRLSLALAALEPIERCDSSEDEGEDKQDAEEGAEEEGEEEEEEEEVNRRKSKKRKIIKGEGEAEDSTASRESSPGAEE